MQCNACRDKQAKGKKTDRSETNLRIRMQNFVLKNWNTFFVRASRKHSQASNELYKRNEKALEGGERRSDVSRD